MLALYNLIIYQPLLNLLVFFYNIIPGHDVGIAIIILTLLIRVLLAPSTAKSLRSQKAMSALQPKLNELREKHKDNKEGQAKAMMGLYKEHKISPLSSCLPLLIQLPILIALYQVFDKALKGSLTGLYVFISNPEHLNPKFFNLIDLSQPNLPLAVLAGLAQFWQSRMIMKANPSSDSTTKAITMQTTYVLPFISVIIALKLPAGLPLYWIVTTLFGIAQQYYIFNKKSPAKV